MAADDALPPSLQESILAALVFDDRWGALIAAQVEPRHFDDTYRQIATTILQYRQEYSRPPGRSHLDDMFGKAVIEGRSPRLRRLLFGLSALTEGLNAEYVANRAQEFIRRQTLKGAILEASALYQSGGLEPDVTQVEAVLDRALRTRSETFDAGIFMNDPKRAMEVLDTPTVGTPLGIKELDHLDLYMTRKELLLFLAAKGEGKTWFAVHCGKQGLVDGQWVLHISLEFRKGLVAGRYWQSFFGAARKPGKFERTTLELDRLERLIGFKTRSMTPPLVWRGPDSKAALVKKAKPWGIKLRRLIVQDFPSGQLTIAKLEHYLDYLELQHKFIPTVVIVDYPALMKLDPRNIRTDLGRTVVELRGLAVARNFALVAPHQGHRAAMRAKRVRSDMASEDITVVNTADNVLAQSRTEAEKRMGLARLSVEHARNTESGSEILITQSYPTGQYVLKSAWLNAAYWKQLEAETGQGEEVEE
jgi:hypothetical protein